MTTVMRWQDGAPAYASARARVDGMAFFGELSKPMPNVAKRLVFVTGDVAGSDAESFLEESGCRWIAKPFRLRDPVRVARETLG